MICAFCKKEIDADSFYCDQCGEEIKICPKCGKAGKGKICTSDGTKLIMAKDKQPDDDDKTIPVKQEVATPKPPPPGVKKIIDDTPPPKPGEKANPVITLRNNAVNIKFSPKHEDVVGRKKGNFAHLFAQYKQISGQHAKFMYSPETGWMVADLGSSNGTKYRDKKLIPNNPVKLENGTHLLLANIEFFIEII